jgi:hypothetical protein
VRVAVSDGGFSQESDGGGGGGADGYGVANVRGGAANHSGRVSWMESERKLH